MPNILKLGLPIAIVVFWVFFTFTVDERQKALKLKFGEIVESEYTPGIHFMVPIYHTIRKFDDRILTIDAHPSSFFTGEQKDLIVDSYVKWRIQDVVKYYIATAGDERRAGDLLYQVINNGLRDEFGKRTIQEVVAGDRAEIMGIMTEQAKAKAETLGIEVIDVRIKKIEYPPQVSESVYNRMRTGRERVARDIRSKGAEAAERILADADRQSSVVLAEAYRDSEVVRGQGDAEATDIYSKAYGKNREFYKFYRSINAYTNNFSSKDDVILIGPDSEYFDYFNQSKSGK